MRYADAAATARRAAAVRFFFQAEDGIRDGHVTGVQTCALPILPGRFTRIESEATRHLVGLGIGLYIVQEVANAHGGQVLVDSRPGVGSEFTLELPRSITARPGQPPRT